LIRALRNSTPLCKRIRDAISDHAGKSCRAVTDAKIPRRWRLSGQDVAELEKVNDTFRQWRLYRLPQ
jgi:hypothetical protein